MLGVLACSRALRVCMLARSHAWRVCVFACQRAWRVCELTGWRAWRASMCVLCLRASYLPSNLPLTYSRFCLINYLAVDTCKFELTGVIIKMEIAAKKQQIS